jgi:hypothetical protein
VVARRAEETQIKASGRRILMVTLLLSTSALAGSVTQRTSRTSSQL